MNDEKVQFNISGTGLQHKIKMELNKCVLKTYAAYVDFINEEIARGNTELQKLTQKDIAMNYTLLKIAEMAFERGKNNVPVAIVEPGGAILCRRDVYESLYPDDSERR